MSFLTDLFRCNCTKEITKLERYFMTKLSDLAQIISDDVAQLNAAHELIVAKIAALELAIMEANPDVPVEVQVALDELNSAIQHEAEIAPPV